jgi:hypothetical protein
MIKEILKIVSGAIILSIPIQLYNEVKRDRKIQNQLDKEFMESVIRSKMNAEDYRKSIWNKNT